MPVSANLASPQLAADFFERQYRRVHFGEIQSTPGAGRSATTFAQWQILGNQMINPRATKVRSY
jgi:hypothetical protein